MEEKILWYCTCDALQFAHGSLFYRYAQVVLVGIRNTRITVPVCPLVVVVVNKLL